MFLFSEFNDLTGLCDVVELDKRYGWGPFRQIGRSVLRSRVDGGRNWLRRRGRPGVRSCRSCRFSQPTAAPTSRQPAGRRNKPAARYRSASSLRRANAQPGQRIVRMSFDVAAEGQAGPCAPPLLSAENDGVSVRRMERHPVFFENAAPQETPPCRTAPLGRSVRSCGMETVSTKPCPTSRRAAKTIQFDCTGKKAKRPAIRTIPKWRFASAAKRDFDQ